MTAVAAIDRWAVVHQRRLIAGLVAAAVVLRALLVIFSPTPFGYVWDFYAEGIKVLYTQGRLPVLSDCWVCYHPPLFFIVGAPFYAFGLFVSGGSETAALRWTGALSMIAAAVTIYYGYRLLRLYRCRGLRLVFGLAILLVFPCLFISSYGAEADILLTAIMSAFGYYLVRATAKPGLMRSRDAFRLGALTGLAALTKASGLAGIATMAVVGLGAVALGPDRARVLRLSIFALVVALPLSGWKYLDNWRQHETLFYAEGTASQGFSMSGRTTWGRPYEFTTFRLSALRRAIGPHIQTGTKLADLEAYDSVFTTLHALAWSDMSVFSVTSRHGSNSSPYPWKSIPGNLTLSVILLGFVPSALALIGLAATIRRQRLAPLVILGVISVAAYVWWFLPQPSWALKTKYVLFLLPPYVLYMTFGLGWLARRIPVAGIAASTLLVVLIVLCAIYEYAFAVGHL